MITINNLPSFKPMTKVYQRTNKLKTNKMECSICFVPQQQNLVFPQVCCVRDVCINCLRKWYNETDVYHKKCMICKRRVQLDPLLGIRSYTSTPEKSAFQLDFSSIKNL